MSLSPPVDERELMGRALRLAGRPLSWVAEQAGWELPPDLRRHKGWVGQLLEDRLGASAGNRAEPDFPHLGVELKTLPCDATGKPKETTYVCTAPLDGSLERRWEDSWVRHKLSRVLWIPIVIPDSGVLGDRRVGAPMLWTPTPEEDALLRADWEELAELIHGGEVWQLSARLGKVLQLRPKAATSRDMTWVLDQEGEWVRENPRGFYLRTRFTGGLLKRHFGL